MDRVTKQMDPPVDHRPSDSDPLDQAWDKVDRAWEDEERHRAFVALAQALGRLADAGRRYRAASAEPGRAETASRMLDRILALAMADLGRLREPPDTSPRRWVLAIGYAVAIALLASAAYLLLRARS